MGMGGSEEPTKPGTVRVVRSVTNAGSPLRNDAKRVRKVLAVTVERANRFVTASWVSARGLREDGPRLPWWQSGGTRICPPEARPRSLPECCLRVHNDSLTPPAGYFLQWRLPGAATMRRAHGAHAFPP